jgi:hypothetical protein
MFIPNFKPRKQNKSRMEGKLNLPDNMSKDPDYRKRLEDFKDRMAKRGVTIKY